MNWLSLVLGLVGPVVKGIETVVGDKAAGATKKQMAHDALDAALQGAIVTTGASTGNAVLAQAAHDVVGLAIDQTVAVAQSSGAYAKWTAAANAAQQDVAVAQAVQNLVATVQTPPAATLGVIPTSGNVTH